MVLLPTVVINASFYGRWTREGVVRARGVYFLLRDRPWWGVSLCTVALGDQSRRASSSSAVAAAGPGRPDTVAVAAGRAGVFVGSTSRRSRWAPPARAVHDLLLRPAGQPRADADPAGALGVRVHPRHRPGERRCACSAHLRRRADPRRLLRPGGPRRRPDPERIVTAETLFAILVCPSRARACTSVFLSGRRAVRGAVFLPTPAVVRAVARAGGLADVYETYLFGQTR